jgi:hypothetical protein
MKSLTENKMSITLTITACATFILPPNDQQYTASNYGYATSLFRLEGPLLVKGPYIKGYELLTEPEGRI